MLTRRSFVGAVACGSLSRIANPIPIAGSAAEGGFAPYSNSGGAGSAGGISPFATPYAADKAAIDGNPKRVLIVVDYQVDFVDGGAFGRIEPAVAIESALCEKIQEYQQAGDIVIYTMDTHPADFYEQTREGQVNPPHCIPGTEGWRIYGRARELLTPESAIQVLKGTYGSPDLPPLIRLIQSQGVRIEYIEFAGVSTTCRVLHNAIIVFNSFPELPMVFDEGTTASYTDERTVEQLEELEAWGFFVKRRPR